MSCLFYQPLELPAFGAISLGAFAVVMVRDAARQMRTESACSPSQHRILPYVAFNKDAFPNRRHTAGGPNHSACQNKPSFFSRESQAQYQAFVRFAVTSSAALESHRAQSGPGVWNLSLGAGSLVSEENSGIHP